MGHRICRVVSFKETAPFTLEIVFSDGASRVIDFSPLLKGPLYGPLRDLSFFRRVQIDSVAHTLVRPNGADFDPATLYDWPECGPAFCEMARNWDAGQPAIAETRLGPSRMKAWPALPPRSAGPDAARPAAIPASNRGATGKMALVPFMLV